MGYRCATVAARSTHEMTHVASTCVTGQIGRSALPGYTVRLHPDLIHYHHPAKLPCPPLPHHGALEMPGAPLLTVR